MRKFSDIIITGSNARMLSNELGTLIGGRYKEIYIHSLSYNEFLKFQQLSDNDEALALYIQYGGLPGLVKIAVWKRMMHVNIKWTFTIPPCSRMSLCATR